MTARHARAAGQPGRTWAPLDGVDPVLPAFDPADFAPADQVLTAEQLLEFRNQVAHDLWVETRKVYGVSEGLVRLAPRLARQISKGVARHARRALSITLYTVALSALIAVGPVLHGLGVQL